MDIYGGELNEVPITGSPIGGGDYGWVPTQPSIPSLPSPGGGGSPGSPGSNGTTVVNGVIKDASVSQNQQLDCILTNILYNNTATEKFLIEFKNSTNYNVIFKAVDVLPGNPPPSVKAITSYTLDDTDVTIFIRNDYVSTDHPAFVAKTIIHEMAHAYLAQKLVDAGGPDNLQDQLIDKDLGVLLDYYSSHVSPVTGEYHPWADNSSQHQAIAQLFVKDIAEGVQQFSEQTTFGLRSNSYVTMDNFVALAWKGLEGTNSYYLYKLLNHLPDNVAINALITPLITNVNPSCP